MNFINHWTHAELKQNHFIVFGFQWNFTGLAEYGFKKWPLTFEMTILNLGLQFEWGYKEKLYDLLICEIKER